MTITLGTPVGPFGKLHEDEATYRSNPAITRSILEDYLRNPRLCQGMHITGEYQKPDSDSFRVGTAAHCLVLEPDEFTARYIVPPKMDRRTKEGKEAFSAFGREHAGKKFLDQEEFDLVHRMAEAVSQNACAQDLLWGAEVEVVYRHNGTPLATQCRVDAVTPTHVVDLKTTESLAKFKRSLWDLGYHRQAAWYLEHVDPQLPFIFIAVEKSAPYAVGIFQIESRGLSMARDQLSDALARLADSIATNRWERDAGVIETVNAPPWLP